MSWTRNYYYSWPNEEQTRTRVATSPAEVTQIVIAYVVLTVDLILIFGNLNALSGFDTSLLYSSFFLPLVAVSAVAALTGFVAHEMAHKMSAQRRGFWAEFRLSPIGLLVSIVTAVLGFLWAAPGATIVSGVDERDREDWGHIALAGPLMNVAFGAAFYVGSVGLFLANSDSYFWLLMLAFVNMWFGTFNLIPIGPLDGRKVLRWSTAVWALTFLAVAAFTAVVAIAFYVYGDPLFV
jgi:Zn-dependent protease